MYIDSNGYKRDKDNKLIHRKIAYERIYLPNRKQYSLPFSKYIVHHKNRNKRDNHPENLELLKDKEHKKKHGIFIKAFKEYREEVSFYEKVLISLIIMGFGLIGFGLLLTKIIYLIIGLEL